jgi:molybdopterin-guanine dinucleotide biosynthesis protein B
MSGQAPALGFAAWSGSGKTTLLTRLVPVLRSRGLRIGVVKHAHHDFEIDYPGKDSYELRKAGATQVVVGSRKRWALIVETEAGPEPRLPDLMRHLQPDSLDLVLVEGFKLEGIPKIEIHRPSLGKPLLATGDASIIAVASDAPIATPRGLPILDLNDIPGIAAYVVRYASAT